MSKDEKIIMYFICYMIKSLVVFHSFIVKDIKQFLWTAPQSTALSDVPNVEYSMEKKSEEY